MRLFSPLGNNVFCFKIQCLSILRLSSGPVSVGVRVGG